MVQIQQLQIYLIQYNTIINILKVGKILFKYTIRGFSNYVIGKSGFIIRLDTVTKHNHYKRMRLVSFRKDGRVTLYSDKGKKETLSKLAIKKKRVREIRRTLIYSFILYLF